MVSEDSGGIDIPNGIREAVGKAVENNVPLAIEAHDLLNSIDSINKTAEANVRSYLTAPDEWTRILTYNTPGEGPNLGDKRLLDTIVVKKVVGTNANGEPRPMQEFTYVSNQLRPDCGIPWTTVVIYYQEEASNDLVFRSLTQYSGFESRKDTVDYARNRLSCWDGRDASVEVFKSGKSSKEKEEDKNTQSVTNLVPAPQTIPTK